MKEAAKRYSIVPQSRPSEKNAALGSSSAASHHRVGQRRITAERFSPITFITYICWDSRRRTGFHPQMCIAKALTNRRLACKHALMRRPHSSSTTGNARLKEPAGASKEPLQVRIPTDVKRRFKAHAAMRGIAPHKLFVEVWEHYERTRA